MISLIQKCTSLTEGAVIFGYCVNDPERYGIVEFGAGENVLNLEEKPQNPRSNFAVPGIYFYDHQVVKSAEAVIPSARGEIEITDLNKLYLASGQLKVKVFGRGVAGCWHARIPAPGSYVHRGDPKQAGVDDFLP